MDFDKSVQNFVDKTEVAFDEAIKASVLQLVNNIVQRSPVGNAQLWENPKSAPKGYVGGRFRHNWQVSFGNNNTELKGNANDATTKAEKKIKSAKIFQPKYIITNNLPYAERLELGWSKQAAKGKIVKANVNAFSSILDKEANKRTPK